MLSAAIITAVHHRACPFSELELDSLVTIAFLPCDPGSDDFSLNLAVVYNI